MEELLVVAGSQGFTGAAYLCTEATVKVELVL